jgi:hypothetical protein
VFWFFENVKIFIVSGKPGAVTGMQEYSKEIWTNVNKCLLNPPPDFGKIETYA